MSLSEVNKREKAFHNKLHLSEELERRSQGKFYKALYGLYSDFLNLLKNETKTKDVLDFGCGTGNFTKKVINFLKKQKKIKEILYPHNPSSKNYKLWKKYYSGATGLLSIVIKSKKKSSVVAFVNSLELFGIGYSWGGFESLAILQEIKSFEKDEYLKGRQFYRFNNDEFIVRLHIGLEDPKDLINDLKKGLKKIK